MKNNIFYLLGHQTLTDFEVPILIKRGFGVYIPKKYDSLDKKHSLYNYKNTYDNYLNMKPEDIRVLNDIDWYSNKLISSNVMNLLNEYFNIIFITLLTDGELLSQLVEQFYGKICYRFFGRESTLSYKPCIKYEGCNKFRYLFSYEEIIKFENCLNDFFTENNSYVIPLGVSNCLINNIEYTYHPVQAISRICFVCSKINLCSYYTKIYNEFVNNFRGHNYVIIGRNNALPSSNQLLSDLDDYAYYKEISKSKVMYYHGVEPRHLHYHPIEAIFIGIPIIFHAESLLSKYLSLSPGRCHSISEAQVKINRILNDDIELINNIINEQNCVKNIFKMQNNMTIFDKLFEVI